MCDKLTQLADISIHALREEGDSIIAATTRRPRNFYPRPPRGGRPPATGTLSLRGRFLSTPSARRATAPCRHPADRPSNFYPRPPRGGRRSALPCQWSSGAISIHALREEGDCLPSADVDRMQEFLSTPSARRATHRRCFPRGVVGISIHALREEGDLKSNQRVPQSILFLSTPSARRATNQIADKATEIQISIHALREEGDWPSVSQMCGAEISIHALREEGDDQNGKIS